MTCEPEEIILEARDIVRRYPGSVALDHVTFRVIRGCVNVLIGENGAGKSTLMRILAGVERQDCGELVLDGRGIELASPSDAFAHGISIVHQELAVLPNLNIAENIFAGRELVRYRSFIDHDNENRRSSSALRELQSPMAVSTSVAELPLGRRQLVELARTVAHGARIVILDEPTSALSNAESSSLFEVIEELKEKGVTIIYISHRLHELIHLGDYFTVLRNGQVVGEGRRGEVDRRWIVERMSGDSYTSQEGEMALPSSEELLTVNHFSVGKGALESAGTSVADLSFSLGRGEILGIYGLLGSGRTELLEALAGARGWSGSVRLEGEQLQAMEVKGSARAGIVLVPEDRQRDGLFPDLSIRENVALAAGHGPFLSRAKESAAVRALANDLNLSARDLELPVTSLSGGNQQKVLIARCLLRSPKVLLLDEPTRGVDVNAKREIYRILKKLATTGLSIIFTSSEIEETRILAHRVLVLCQGQISAELSALGATDEALFAAASPAGIQPVYARAEVS